ncbi:MAG TPA: hypothetical protein VM282_07575 [Acidimicrobiales bacterium]|nr:hypothetical protein [Acidimicrobiales bacterium]
MDDVRSRYLDGTGPKMKADMALSAFVSSFFSQHDVNWILGLGNHLPRTRCDIRCGNMGS